MGPDQDPRDVKRVTLTAVTSTFQLRARCVERALYLQLCVLYVCSCVLLRMLVRVTCIFFYSIRLRGALTHVRLPRGDQTKHAFAADQTKHAFPAASHTQNPLTAFGLAADHGHRSFNVGRVWGTLAAGACRARRFHTGAHSTARLLARRLSRRTPHAEFAILLARRIRFSRRSLRRPVGLLLQLVR
eukprot:1620814-Prymnesium_polylepis.2